MYIFSLKGYTIFTEFRGKKQLDTILTKLNTNFVSKLVI